MIQDVSHAEFETISIGRSDSRQEELFGPARAEPLDQPLNGYSVGQRLYLP